MNNIIQGGLNNLGNSESSYITQGDWNSLEPNNLLSETYLETIRLKKLKEDRDSKIDSILK